MKKELICIICPRGCSMTVEGEGNNLKVSGNACKRGEKYAIDECTHPMRTVTSTVRVANRECKMLSVKTRESIPKENIFDIMKMIRSARVDAPVKIGDVIIANAFGTYIVATENIN